MSRTFEELGIANLSIEQKIDLIGTIWDSIPDLQQSFAPPEWHIRILED